MGEGGRGGGGGGGGDTESERVERERTGLYHQKHAWIRAAAIVPM